MNSNNIHNMFIFILVMVAVDSLLFSAQCLANSKFDLPDRLNNHIVYDTLDTLYSRYDHVNLARGTPELLPPTFLTNALSNLSTTTNVSIHEYMPIEGYAGLRKEIALFYSKLINRTLNISNNVVITMGVTQAIYLTINTHTNPGDEWIVLEPTFEDYYVNIKMARGTVKPVLLRNRSTNGTLRSGDFVFDKTEMTNAFNSKTKGIIVNNPHNPTGKSFTKEELLFMGKLAVKWNAIILSDEVYEWTNYDSNKHIRMASLGEDIFKQTITASSLSKTFFASGFRVGWAYGPTQLIQNLQSQQPYMIYSGNSYAQVAAVDSIRKMRKELGKSNSYLDQHQNVLQQKRNFTLQVLKEIKLDAVVPQAGFFIYMNYTKFATRKIANLSREDGKSRDWKFISWLIKKTGILFYPGTGLYENENKAGEDFIRLCFAKSGDVLSTAAGLMKKLK